MNKKILIVGSLGLVGSEAMDFFDGKGWETVGIDNNGRSVFFNTPTQEYGKTLHVDIRDEEKIELLFKENKFDAVINCCAQPSHDYSKEHVLEDFDINARGTVLLLEATRKHCPNAVFVFVSTDKVYGGNMYRPVVDGTLRFYDPAPFTEKVSIDQAIHSPFGCSKAAADLYVQEYGYCYGLKTVCFRCGCITGRRHAGAEAHGFLSYLVKCIKEDRVYKIFGFKGKQVRDQIHAYDLVNAFWHFIENPKVAAVYNMGGGRKRAVSILSAIRSIEKALGKEALVEFIDEERKGDRNWDIHDVSKFQKDYPAWQYKFSLKNIINDLCS